jgi:hypothetical protein
MNDSPVKSASFHSCVKEVVRSLYKQKQTESGPRIGDRARRAPYAESAVVSEI